MDLTGSIPSVGYKELIKKDLGFIAYPNQKKNLHLWGRFLLFTFGFCKKRAFFRLKSIFSPEWLTLWLWNHDILKVRSKCDPMVYDMSMFHENSSTQIFFTKKCQLSHRKVVVPWTLSYQDCLGEHWYSLRHPCARVMANTGSHKSKQPKPPVWVFQDSF